MGCRIPGQGREGAWAQGGCAAPQQESCPIQVSWSMPRRCRMSQALLSAQHKVQVGLFQVLSPCHGFQTALPFLPKECLPCGSWIPSSAGALPALLCSSYTKLFYLSLSLLLFVCFQVEFLWGEKADFLLFKITFSSSVGLGSAWSLASGLSCFLALTT